MFYFYTSESKVDLSLDCSKDSISLTADLIYYTFIAVLIYTI